MESVRKPPTVITVRTVSVVARLLHLDECLLRSSPYQSSPHKLWLSLPDKSFWSLLRLFHTGALIVMIFARRCKAPTCSSGAIWCSASCSRTLYHAVGGAGESNLLPRTWRPTLPSESQLPQSLLLVFWFKLPQTQWSTVLFSNALVNFPFSKMYDFTIHIFKGIFL